MVHEKYPHSLCVEDASRMTCATTHIGSQNVNSAMQTYVFKRRKDGFHIIDISKTWEKLFLACRVLAAIKVPSDIVFISSRKFGQRAVLKAARYTGAHAIAGKFTPGTFTNCLSKGYKEPRVVVVTDPMADSQAIREAALVNVPVIAFCDCETSLKNIDIAIPCSTRSAHSIGLVWWLLTREFLYITGRESRTNPWSVMPDMFFYRDPEVEKEAEAARQQAAAAANAAAMAIAPNTSNTYMAPTTMNTMYAPHEAIMNPIDEQFEHPVLDSVAEPTGTAQPQAQEEDDDAYGWE